MRRWLTLLLLLLLALPQLVLADAAPLYPAGPTLQPLAETRVRMAREEIQIRVARAGPLTASTGQELLAEVQVRFHFLPAEDEVMEAGFPLRMSLPVNESAVLEDFTVQVNGVLVPHKEGKVRYGGFSEWAIWPLSFKAGQPEEVLVRYRISFTRGKRPELRLFYILQTGSFWAGSIGEARATVTFDRPFQVDDILPDTTPGYERDGSSLTWVWRDLEPDFDLDVQVRDIYWLDLPSEAAAHLAAPPTRESLLAASTAVRHMLSMRSRGDNWEEVRGGVIAGDAAEPYMAELLTRFDQLLQANPGDEELRGERLALLRESLWDVRYSPDGLIQAHLQSAVRLRQYLAEGPAPGAPIWEPVRFLVDTYQASTDPGLRSLVLAHATEPLAFASQQEAEAWVAEVIAMRQGLPPEMAADLRQAVLPKVAAAPASGPVPGPEQPPGPEPRAGNQVAQMRAIFILVAFIVVVLIGIKWVILLRRIGILGPMPPAPPRPPEPEPEPEPAPSEEVEEAEPEEQP